MLRVRVERGSERVGECVAKVTDERYPYIVVTFEFTLSGGRVHRTGFSIRWKPGSRRRDVITMYQLRRELPLSAWERAAQLEVLSALGGPDPEQGRDSRGADARLRQVAREYADNVRDGLPNPVGAIAERHAVKPETARSWVHRARLKGYLGPADVGRAGVSADARRGAAPTARARA